MAGRVDFGVVLFILLLSWGAGRSLYCPVVGDDKASGRKTNKRLGEKNRGFGFGRSPYKWAGVSPPSFPFSSFPDVASES